MGVVYYANYLVWFEVARTDWLRASGSTYRQMELDGIALPVVEAHCEYKRPAKYDDEVEIRTTGAAISPVRVQFRYEVVRATDQAVLATGHTVHASMGRDGRVQRLPDRVRTLFS
jgi:acyl-CoA thioester hydrolase